MAILIDTPRWRHRGDVWCHLVSDESHAELHAFAARLGVPRRAFQRDHYDLPSRLHAAALEAGAVLVPSTELVRRLRAAGLRRGRRDRLRLLPGRPLTRSRPAPSAPSTATGRRT